MLTDTMTIDEKLKFWKCIERHLNVTSIYEFLIFLGVEEGIDIDERSFIDMIDKIISNIKKNTTNYRIYENASGYLEQITETFLTSWTFKSIVGLYVNPDTVVKTIEIVYPSLIKEYGYMWKKDRYSIILQESYPM